MSIRIQVRPPGSEPRVLEFEESVVTIGRGADNHIVIDDARSSRKHASVSLTAHGVVLEDLGSSNGTRRDGETVTRVLIEPGDTFQIGKTEFCYDPSSDAGADLGSRDTGDSVEASGLASEVELESSQETAVATAGAVVARLRKVQGSLADSSVELASFPFVIGRGKEADLTLDDRRVSTKHAEILRRKNVLVVRDLGSRNGCAVDNKLVKKGAILAQGSKLSIGEHVFDVELEDASVIEATAARTAGSAASASKRAASAAPGPHESDPSAGKLSVDVESLLRSDQLGQTVSTAVLVVIVLVVAYYAVDVAQRLLSTEPLDPRAESNLVENWSFELGPEVEGGAGIPGWALAEGSEGEVAFTSAEARDPGRQALLLTAARPRAADGRDLICSVSQSQTVPVSVDRRYLLEGFVANQSAFAAGLSIDWFRGQGRDRVLVGRSFSATAKGRGEMIDVSQIVYAPSGAGYGVLSCFAFGPGSAIFDQISLTSLAGSESLPVAEQSSGSTEKTDEARSEFEFRLTSSEEPLLAELREGGIFTVRRGSRRVIPYLSAGVDLQRDPLAFGPRLSEMRIRSGDSGRMITTTQVPDLETREFASLETSVSSDTSAISIRWRLESGERADEGESERGSSARALVLQLQSSDRSLAVVAHGDSQAGGGAGLRGRFTEIQGGPFIELVFGDENLRTSLEFSSAVRVETVDHPTLVGRSLMLIEPANGSAELGVSISHGSRREAQAARLVLTQADRLFGEGRDREALALLENLDEKYPLQAGEIAAAGARIRQWNAAAKEVESDLDLSIEAFRANPSKVVFDSLLSRIEQLERRYSGTSQAAVMKSKAEALRGSRAAADERIRRTRATELIGKARDALSAQQFGLADLYVRLLLDTWSENDAIRADAERLRTQIAGRRRTATELLLEN